MKFEQQRRDTHRELRKTPRDGGDGAECDAFRITRAVAVVTSLQLHRM